MLPTNVFMFPILGKTSVFVSVMDLRPSKVNLSFNQNGWDRPQQPHDPYREWVKKTGWMDVANKCFHVTNIIKKMIKLI